MPATYAAGLSGSAWGIIAASATALVAVLTLAFNLVNQHREDVDKKVEKSVDAKLGHTLNDLRSSESEAREAVDKAKEIERQLRQGLSDSRQSYDELGKLIQSATSMLPAIEKSSVAIPRVLVQEARESAKSGDFPDANGYLSALLASSEGASRDYESGGDIAVAIGSHSLANELYEKAIKINPRNVTANASLILTQATLGKLPAEEIAKVARALALRCPHTYSVLADCFNSFMEVQDYQGLRDLCRELQKTAPDEPVIWRNLAIGLERTQGADDEIANAYETHLNLISLRGDETISDGVYPYLSFLRKRRQFDKEKEIIKRALSEDPLSCDLLKTYAEAELKTGNTEKAADCYRKMIEIARNGADKRIGEEGLTLIAARMNLEGAQIISSGGGAQSQVH